jgi:hypothetical protein
MDMFENLLSLTIDLSNDEIKEFNDNIMANQYLHHEENPAVNIPSVFKIVDGVNVNDDACNKAQITKQNNDSVITEGESTNQLNYTNLNDSCMYLSEKPAVSIISVSKNFDDISNNDETCNKDPISKQNNDLVMVEGEIANQFDKTLTTNNANLDDSCICLSEPSCHEQEGDIINEIKPCITPNMEQMNVRNNLTIPKANCDSSIYTSNDMCKPINIIPKLIHKLALDYSKIKLIIYNNISNSRKTYNITFCSNKQLEVNPKYNEVGKKIILYVDHEFNWLILKKENATSAIR